MEALAAIAVIVLVAAVFAGVGALAVVLGRRSRQLRADRSALVPLAQQRGWHYQPSDTGSADRFQGEPLPQVSRNLRVSHLITGTVRGRAFSCFEYARRAVGANRGTSSSRYEHFRVFAVQAPAAGPTLQVRRAGFGGRMLDRVGAGGLTLDDEEFDAAFRVTGDDEGFARQVLTADVRRFLLDDPRSGQWPLRFERDELVTWQPGRMKASSVDEALDYVSDLLDRVSAAAWAGR